MKARTVPQAAREFARANQTAAAVILANPERYGGESAAVVQWARLVLKHSPEETHRRSGRVA